MRTGEENKTKDLTGKIERVKNLFMKSSWTWYTQAATSSRFTAIDPYWDGQRTQAGGREAASRGSDGGLMGGGR